MLFDIKKLKYNSTEWDIQNALVFKNSCLMFVLFVCGPRIITVCLFQVISLEGWTDIMYYVQDAHSFWDWIYFVLLIVVSYISYPVPPYFAPSFRSPLTLTAWIAPQALRRGHCFLSKCVSIPCNHHVPLVAICYFCGL